MKKKAQSMQTLVFGAIMFITLIISLVIGATLTTNLRDNTARASLTTINETVTTATDDVNATLVHSADTPITITEVRNGTTILAAGSGGTENYSIYSDGNFQLNHSGTYNVSYVHTELNAPYNMSGQGASGVSTFGDYLTVIATIIVLVVIVGLLIGVIALFARPK